MAPFEAYRIPPLAHPAATFVSAYVTFVTHAATGKYSRFPHERRACFGGMWLTAHTL
jgi:hypothetical protein